MALSIDELCDFHELLITLGDSFADCQRRLPDAMSDYTYKELKRFDSLWAEEWLYDEITDEFRWTYHRFLDVVSWRKRVSTTQQHAARRARKGE